jgi:hypothetical protein
VRFGVAKDVVAVGEGIETMLSVRCILPRLPMIAALSANHLAALGFPTGVRRVYVVRDSDDAGLRGSARLTDLTEQRGIETISVSPHAGDFNDDLRRVGTGKLLTRIRVQLSSLDTARFLVGFSTDHDPRPV